jgi:hypothetical protein
MLGVGARRSTNRRPTAARTATRSVRLIFSLSLVAGIALVSLWLLVSNTKRPATTLRAPAAGSAPVAVRDATPQVEAHEMSIAGRVRGRAGNALAGARVCATTVSSEALWTPILICAVTDASGRYRIAPLASTAYDVTAVADGFQPASALLGNAIFLAQGEAKTGVDLVLEPGGAKLSGWVFDATGGPISGAMIRVLRQAVPHDTVVASSGPDGRFAVSVAPGPVTVLADALEYASARVAHVAPSSDLVLRLTPGSTISGRVVAESTGAAAAGVVVRAVPAHGWNSPTQPSATSDADGAFELRGLEPNSYTLVGEGAGWRGELHPALPIGLAQRVDGVTLTVSAAAIITGKVIRHDNQAPCSRGTVSLGPPEAPPAHARAPLSSPTPMVPTILSSLQADGTVRFEAVPAGKYYVNVQCSDFLLSDGPTTLDIGHADVNGVVWQVEPGVRLSVHAVDELDQPVANAHLWLSSDPANNGAGPPRHIPFITDNGGKHELTGLPPGLYVVEPGSGYEAQPVTIDARSSEKVDATIHLQGRGSILVTVQAPDGTGVDQVEVSAAMLSDESPPAADLHAKTSAASADHTSSGRSLRRGTPATALGNGRFQIGPLAAGAYRVQASDGVNPPAEPTDWPRGAVRVRAGVAHATVILRRGGSIRGRVVDSSGQGLPDLWVSADCSSRSTDKEPSPLRARVPLRSGSAARVVSDPEGRFRIDGLERDVSCVVRAEQPGGSIAVSSKVHPGDEAVITLPALGSLSGTARLPNGSPAASFTLAVRDPETGVARSETVSAIDGRWSLAQVVPGHLLLSAFEPTGGAAQARFDLGPGEQRAGIELQFRTIPSSRLASDSN